MALRSHVTELLDRLAIPYQIVQIPLSEGKKPVRSLEELVEAMGGRREQVIRSLLFRTESGRFVLLALPSGKRADWSALRSHLGEKRMALASPEEVVAATGYPVGAVPPIALPEAVRLLVDASALESDPVVIGSGVLGYALRLSRADFGKALPERTEVGRFTQA